MKNTFRLIIAGSRNFSDYDLLEKRCQKFLWPIICEEVIILSGGASGADSLGEKFAAQHFMMTERYPANWNKYGKRAGPLRNQEMASAADGLILFWDGTSRGSKNMLACALTEKLIVESVICEVFQGVNR